MRGSRTTFRACCRPATRSAAGRRSPGPSSFEDQHQNFSDGAGDDDGNKGVGEEPVCSLGYLPAHIQEVTHDLFLPTVPAKSRVPTEIDIFSKRVQPALCRSLL